MMSTKHCMYNIFIRRLLIQNFLLVLVLSTSAVTSFSFKVNHPWSYVKHLQKQQFPTCNKNNDSSRCISNVKQQTVSNDTKQQQRLKPLFASSSSSKDQNERNWKVGDVTIRKAQSAILEIYGTYMKALDKKPLITKSITTAFVSVLGDRLAQGIEANTAGTVLVLNWVRLSTFFIAGGVFVGPFVHTWYEQLWKLGRWMERKYGSSKKLQTVVQVITDQTIGVAMFFPTYFYVYEAIEAAIGMRVPSFHMATAKCREQIGSVLLLQYYVWPLTNWINFAYIPESLRVLVSDLVAVMFNAYLCTLVA
mmetsp:Transcript_7512/g.10671  ORF Transcript_7512/g.10671 Transcript_7512/m.10671 type:complete len:307 (+) Transcript_7512:244-1164(+)